MIIVRINTIFYPPSTLEVTHFQWPRHFTIEKTFYTILFIQNHSITASAISVLPVSNNVVTSSSTPKLAADQPVTSSTISRVGTNFSPFFYHDRFLWYFTSKPIWVCNERILRSFSHTTYRFYVISDLNLEFYFTPFRIIRKD